jgi:4-amino-4-deoxy-L-arabinose transferase-like glycosyltransferase
MPSTDYSEFEREWIELLNEVRVLLPGVQMLFAFLLAMPLFDRFADSVPSIHRIYLAGFLSATGACAFLVAPSVYHRLHWRRDVRDKETMLRTCNRLAIVGVVLLAVSMTSTVFVMAFLVFGAPLAIATTGLVAATFGALWFVLPLLRRRRERERP